MFNMVIFGPPGCGKGTQSKRVIDHYDFLHLSTGDLLRKEVASGSAMGELLSKFMDRGLLVPDSIVLRELFRYALAQQNYPGIVFDGFPRNLYQAQLLDRVFYKRELRIGLVISIEVEEEELEKRVIQRSLDSGRSDDVPDVMHNRLLVYWSQTSPVIKYYKRCKRLVTVNGMGSVDEVSSRIFEAIDNKMAQIKKI